MTNTGVRNLYDVNCRKGDVAVARVAYVLRPGQSVTIPQPSSMDRVTGTSVDATIITQFLP